MMNTNDMGDEDAHEWLIIYAIHYSCLPDHVFIGACDKFVATQLLKS